MFKGIRYFSVAVTNLDEAIERYEKLFGLQVMTPPNERRFGFISATLGNGEQSLIELIQPSGDDSNLGRFMKERAMPSNPNGEGIYMVSIEVDDIEKTVEQIKEQRRQDHSERADSQRGLGAPDLRQLCLPGAGSAVFLAGAEGGHTGSSRWKERGSFNRYAWRTYSPLAPIC